MQEPTERSFQHTVRSALDQMIDRKYAVDRIRIFGGAFEEKKYELTGILFANM